MVRVLLRIVAPRVNEEFVQRIGIYLLNSLACQVDGHEKKLIGDKGGIEVGVAAYIISRIRMLSNFNIGMERHCVF